MLREFQIDVQDLPIGLLPALGRLEGRMPCTQLIAEHADTPDIDHFIILVPHDNLGRDVIESSTEGRPFISRIMEKCTFFLCKLTSRSRLALQHC